MSASIRPFQRYEPEDATALIKNIENDLQLLGEATVKGDTAARMRLLGKIGGTYTILEREAEAEPLLQEALALARQLDDKPQIVANVIRLATALQYLGERQPAEEMFKEALGLVKEYEQPYYEDFALQHYGRCLMELGRTGEAINCFEQALALRKAKGNPELITSTERALAAARAEI